MSKFRKKPAVIEAEQFILDSRAFPEGVHFLDKHDWYGTGYYLDTLEGKMSVYPGDWIITGVKGERYACKPDIFVATYEPVADTPRETNDE